jgi:tetratricopeptide (TPR) repeat protein
MSLNKSKVLRTAEKYVLQGKIPAAIDEYRKVVDADPADLTTINTLGDLYVRAGKIQDAIANFSRIADSYREGGFTLKAIAMLKKISKLDPTNIETAMKLANLYSQQGLLVEARQQYLQVADAYARQGQTRKALEAYQKIADLDPSNTSVRMKLGEIYSREDMKDQAHEAFIMAGTEFLRKGDIEQALNANLKAIGVNPDSRQALTAIATIYTQQGQIDRAINILCEAFERNPGDVELLTILGRTYLSAGLMDDAERTFLSLIELDRNRYHYLLEVGRRFLQIGDLDRAAEQIDGCIDILITKREEDKAIDFLRRILDRDMNHIGALKRLAQIFQRIREDHNLMASLNSLVEAAMRKGDDEEAIAALKELTKLEPDEPMHLQRLYNLGVKDIVSSDAPDVVRATGPLDYESAAFDDAFVIRQISEAEILAGHGQIDHAVEILGGILAHTPENVQVHQKLKDIYLRAGMLDKAAQECLSLGRIHEARGESARASDYFAEARQIDPSIEAPSSHSEMRGDWSDHVNNTLQGGVQAEGAEGFNAADGQESADSMDWMKYQTGALTDQTGFVMVPEDGSSRANENGAEGDDFRYSDTLVGEQEKEGENPVADFVFSVTGNLPSDTMPRVLRDELEGIDFYIAQGYVEIARDTLDRLHAEHGDHPEVLQRYAQLNGDDLAAPVVARPENMEEEAAPNQPVGTTFFKELPGQPADFARDGAIVAEGNGNKAVDPNDLTFPVSRGPKEAEQSNPQPFIIHKESGPLYPDLLVQLNTSDLLIDTAFDSLRLPTGALAAPLNKPIGTGDLINSIVDSIDSSFAHPEQGEKEPEVTSEILEAKVVEQTGEADLEAVSENEEATAAGEASSFAEERDSMPFDMDAAGFAMGTLGFEGNGAEVDSTENESVEGEQSGLGLQPEEPPAPEPAPVVSRLLSPEEELQQIFEELKDNGSELKPLIDFETHYSLGLAYKDMELLDDAIEEFQRAFKMAGAEDPKGDYIQCCNMLGVCFKRKCMPTVAVQWFNRGLKIPNRPEDEYQALRYEIGMCYEEIGDTDKALDAYMEVYGLDVGYREVAEKIKELRAGKNE